ncbi:DUF6325 family protein [Cryptosporangium minutisporangium]|uniref:Uncharacterized protein n=1 Tax=Cryptosporangium minutisporangium TaxID=113569 RepID=A0ABP6SRA5_9ACTN
MALGPLELLVLTFPADRFDEGVRATLDPLSIGGEMRIVDALALCGDPLRGTRAVELSDRPALRGDPVAPAGLATGLIRESDLHEAAALVDTRTLALVVLLEHRWVHDLAGPVAASRGTIVGLTHISGLPGRVRRLATVH